jgi:hypothetical protein
MHALTKYLIPSSSNISKDKDFSVPSMNKSNEGNSNSGLYKNLLSLSVSVPDRTLFREIQIQGAKSMWIRRLHHTLKFSFNTSTLQYERRSGFFFFFASFITNPALDPGEPNQSGYGSDTRPTVYLRSLNSRFHRHSASG